MSKTPIIVIYVIVALLANAKAATVYSQLSDPEQIDYWLISDIDGAPTGGRQRADNFILAETTTIRSIMVHGRSTAFGDGQLSSDNFLVSFHRLTGSTIYAPLVVFSLGEPVAKVDTQIDTNQGQDIFLYTLNLDVGFVATGNVKYAISIYQDSASDENQWVWAGSRLGIGATDLLAWTDDSPINGDFVLFNNDQALSFSLSDTAAVPEPSGLFLGAMIVGVSVFIRRRNG